jgi:hypothetical protein
MEEQVSDKMRNLSSRRSGPQGKLHLCLLSIRADFEQCHSETASTAEKIPAVWLLRNSTPSFSGLLSSYKWFTKCPPLGLLITLQRTAICPTIAQMPDHKIILLENHLF